MNDMNPLKSRTYTRSRLVGSVRVADLVRTWWTWFERGGRDQTQLAQLSEVITRRTRWTQLDFVDWVLTRRDAVAYYEPHPPRINPFYKVGVPSRHTLSPA